MERGFCSGCRAEKRIEHNDMEAVPTLAETASRAVRKTFTRTCFEGTPGTR